MNIDDPQEYLRLDTHSQMDRICRLPEDLMCGFKAGWGLENFRPGKIDHLVIAATGQAAQAGDTFAAYASRKCAFPITVWKDYDLPKWMQSSNAFVILVVESGNDAETHSAFLNVRQRGIPFLLISPECSSEEGCYLEYPPQDPPYSAFGWVLGALLGASTRAGWVNATDDVQLAVETLHQQIDRSLPSVAVAQNSAKRMAGQLMNRWVTIIASDELRPAAACWKEQINRLSKAWAQVEFLPEMNHSSLAATLQPVEMLGRMVAVFLRAGEDARNRNRSDLTRQGFLMEGIPTDYFDAPGNIPLARMLAAAHFGEFVAYYLAISYGVDPSPAPILGLFASAVSGED